MQLPCFLHFTAVGMKLHILGVTPVKKKNAKKKTKNLNIECFKIWCFSIPDIQKKLHGRTLNTQICGGKYLDSRNLMFLLSSFGTRCPRLLLIIPGNACTWWPRQTAIAPSHWITSCIAWSCMSHGVPLWQRQLIIGHPVSPVKHCKEMQNLYFPIQAFANWYNWMSINAY
jgi:hypothetical protein